jgi:AbrB family looped-hinge helix DNA binding protein
MKVSTKGQVTIPQNIREELGLLPDTEVEFTVVDDGVLLRKAPGRHTRGRSLVDHMRGRARGGMSTDEIMALTRGED